MWGWLAMQGRDSTSGMGQRKLVSKVREVPLHFLPAGGVRGHGVEIQFFLGLSFSGSPRPGVSFCNTFFQGRLRFKGWVGRGIPAAHYSFHLFFPKPRSGDPGLNAPVDLHGGIHGNDHADAAAKEALTHKNPEYSAIGIDSQYLTSKSAWPSLPSLDASSSSRRLASNLTTAISVHALTLPSIADGTISNDPK